MLVIRRSHERGHANHGWLDSYHTFSFGDYHDPQFMGFRSLRVINEDIIEAGEGFPTHPHANMEILTYIIEGELSHKDSMGNGRTIKTGEVQGMSAGTGITHSEFNASETARCHLLQMWIVPDKKSVTPAYGEWLPGGHEESGFVPVASNDGKDGSIIIQQDAKLYVAQAEKGGKLDIPIKPGRFGWLQVASGELQLHEESLKAGDGAAFTADAVKNLTMLSDGKLLLFDLA